MRIKVARLSLIKISPGKQLHVCGAKYEYERLVNSVFKACMINSKSEADRVERTGNEAPKVDGDASSVVFRTSWISKAVL